MGEQSAPAGGPPAIRVRYTDFILSKEEASAAVDPAGGGPAIAAMLRAVGEGAGRHMGARVELAWEPSPFERSSGPDTEATARALFDGDPLYMARL